MKHLKIKNRTGSPVFFAFCTTSSCTCEICQEWLTCETSPISDRRGATFGYLRVEPFAERVDRFCSRWDCVGACFFDRVPSTITWSVLFDYDEGKNYTLGNGKVELSFRYTGKQSTAVNGTPRLKYLLLKNHNRAERLYFVYGTTSQCRCNVCQEWLQFETIPVVDWPGCTVGFVAVEPSTAKVERFCAQWDCIGCCFFGTQPSAIRKAMLFDYDENTNYTIGGGKAALQFTHTLPTTTNWRGGLKLALAVTKIAMKACGGNTPDFGGMADATDFGGTFDGGDYGGDY